MAKNTNQGWAFLKQCNDDKMRQILLESAKKYNFIGYDDDFRILHKKLSRNFHTYRTFYDRVNSMLKPESVTDNKDFNVIIQFVKEQLLRNATFRKAFVDEMHFTSADSSYFVRDFEFRILRSEPLGSLIPTIYLMIILPEKKDLINSIILSPQSLMAMSRMFTKIQIGNSLTLPLTSELYNTTNRIFGKSITARNRFVSDIEQYNLPFYVLVIYAHFLASCSITDINAAEVFINRTISEAENRDPKDNPNGLWSDVRISLIKTFATNISKVSSFAKEVLSEKTFSSTIVISKYIDEYHLKHLLPFSDELIDIIYRYGVTASAKEWAIRSEHNADMFNGKVLFKKFTFPYTKVRRNRYFYVQDKNSQAYALARLYVALKGLNPSKYVIHSFADASFQYVISEYFNETVQRNAKNEIIGKFIEEGEAYVKELEKKVIYLEKIVRSLELKHDHYKHIFAHFRHDVRPRLMLPISNAINKYKEILEQSPDLVEQRDRKWAKNAFIAIDDLYKEFVIFDDLKYNDDITVEDSSLNRILDISDDRMTIMLPDLEELSRIKVKTNIVAFRSQVLGNILENAWSHGFPTKELQDSAKIKVEVIHNDNEVIVSFSNNGLPFNGDPDSVFEFGYKYGPTGHTGEGLYLVRKFMYNCDGDVKITSAPGSEYPFSIILTFKKAK